jgi:hypothetical protein
VTVNMQTCEHGFPELLCRRCAGNNRSGPGECLSVASDAVPPPAVGNKKSASDPSEPLRFKVVNGDVPPADAPWPPSARASEEPIIEGGEPQFDIDDVESMNAPDAERGKPSPQEDLAEEFENTAAPLRANRIAIESHLSELFSPTFVHAYPDAWIEIAYASPAADGKLDKAKHFSAFNLAAAAEFAEAKSNAGYNVYVGVALRGGRDSWPVERKGERLERSLGLPCMG